MNYLDETIPLSFCPGCGHDRIVRAVAESFRILGLDPGKVVVVTDIGCIGMADRYLKTSSFHGLHGRSITYGVGIHLANPELEVVVIMGDGACGIGGTHLINAARRNADITVIVANNFNFGMTGGEHSVTTHHSGITSSTPSGNPEFPFDLIRLCDAAGGTFLARATSFAANLPEIIAEGIRHRGFSLIDIWELCVAYYTKWSRFTKGALLKEISKVGQGIMKREEREDWSGALRISSGKGGGVRIRGVEPIFPPCMEGRRGVVIAGSAGERVRSTATLLGYSAILSGLNVTQKDDYPIFVMRGHSVSEVILSRERIGYTGIDTPDYILILSEDGLEFVKNGMERLDSRTYVLADDSLDIPSTGARVLKFPFRRSTRDLGRTYTGLIGISALIEHSGIIPREALARAVQDFHRSDETEKALNALKRGRGLSSS